MSAPMPIVTRSEPSARQQAVAKWIRSATFQLPARKLEGVPLCPDEHKAGQFAEMMERHFDEHGVSVDGLRDWWLNYNGGFLLVRTSPAYIPFIAQALVAHLIERDVA